MGWAWAGGGPGADLRWAGWDGGGAGEGLKVNRGGELSSGGSDEPGLGAGPGAELGWDGPGGGAQVAGSAWNPAGGPAARSDAGGLRRWR